MWQLVTRVVVVLCLLAAAQQADAQSCSRSINVAGANRPVDDGRIDHALFNTLVLHLTNVERCRAGLRPLSTDANLLRVVATQAANMAQTRTYSHSLRLSGYQTLRDRLRQSRISFRRGGENIALNFVYVLNGRPYQGQGCSFRYMSGGGVVPKHTYLTLAQETMASWMASPGHRQNIMARNMNLMAAAFGVDQGGQLCGQVYIAQVFVGTN